MTDNQDAMRDTALMDSDIAEEQDTGIQGPLADGDGGDGDDEGSESEE